MLQTYQTSTQPSKLDLPYLDSLTPSFNRVLISKSKNKRKKERKKEKARERNKNNFNFVFYI